MDVPDLDGPVRGAADDDVVDGEDRPDSGCVSVECVDEFASAHIPDLDGVVEGAGDDDVVDDKDRAYPVRVCAECFSRDDM